MMNFFAFLFNKSLSFLYFIVSFFIFKKKLLLFTILFHKNVGIFTLPPLLDFNSLDFEHR